MTEPTTNPAPAAKPEASKKVKLRVLVDCALGKPNDVVALSESEAKAAAAEGIADPAPAAVAYAEKLARAAKVQDEAEG